MFIHQNSKIEQVSFDCLGFLCETKQEVDGWTTWFRECRILLVVLGLTYKHIHENMQLYDGMQMCLEQIEKTPSSCCQTRWNSFLYFSYQFSFCQGSTWTTLCQQTRRASALFDADVVCWDFQSRYSQLTTNLPVTETKETKVSYPRWTWFSVILVGKLRH